MEYLIYYSQEFPQFLSSSVKRGNICPETPSAYVYVCLYEHICAYIFSLIKEDFYSLKMTKNWVVSKSTPVLNSSWSNSSACKWSTTKRRLSCEYLSELFAG